MDRERGDEIPFGEPMKIPEHMDSADLFDGPSEDDARSFVMEMLERDPIGVAEAVAAWAKENGPMDPRKGPDQ